MAESRAHRAGRIAGIAAVAVAYARETGLADGLPLALWGHSWGGYGVPDDVAAAFFADFDVRRANEADPELIDAIGSFLAEHL